MIFAQSDDGFMFNRKYRVVQIDRDNDKSNQKHKYAFDNDYIHQTNIHIVTL